VAHYEEGARKELISLIRVLVEKELYPTKEQVDKAIDIALDRMIKDVKHNISRN